MKYKLSEHGVTENGRFVPDDPDNRDWQEYQEWLADGNTPDPLYTPAEQAKKDADEAKEKDKKAKKKKRHDDAKLDNDDTLEGLARRVRRLEEELELK